MTGIESREIRFIFSNGGRKKKTTPKPNNTKTHKPPRNALSKRY